MPFDPITRDFVLSDEMQRLQREKKAGVELQERKHEDWNDNYELYRNKVKTNRLTQRQAVNIPLMKETVKTLLSRIDDPMKVDWKELGGNEQKELIYQEVWNTQARKQKLELIDILDKKNVLLYGFSVKKMNLVKDGIETSVLDVYDMAFDLLYKSWDIESARFLIQQHIFRSLREILADDRYTEEGKRELKLWSEMPVGIVQGEKNKEEWEKKMERLEAMGVQHSEFPFFAGGDVVVNLTEHYTKRWNVSEKKFEKRVVVYAEDKIVLLDEKLEDLIGVDFWPFVVWAEDPETNDVYPDSIADLVRTPNKVINVWYSQLIENRTLKNFQMHWYMPGQNYQPQTYTPGPGMMLPAPPGDDINKVIKPVEISGLEDTLEAIAAIINIVERGSGATAIEKGQPEKGTQTLGEIEILVGKAGERAVNMAKFYRMAWYEFAWKWDRLMHANKPKFIKLFKLGRSGKAYSKKVFSGDWFSEQGYEPIVRSSSEQEQNDIKTIQKFQFVSTQSPQNPALRRITLKRSLELLDLTLEELAEVEEAEEELQRQAQLLAAQQGEQPQTPQEDLMGGIDQRLQELSANA